MSIFRIQVVVQGIFLLFAVPVYADVWMIRNNGRWFDNGGWQGHRVPTAADNVRMTTGGRGGTAQILLPGAVAKHLTIFSNDFSYPPRHPTHLLIAGGGTLSSATGTISDTPVNNTSIVTVTGAGSSWTNSGTLTIGAIGSGSLNISAGGAVSNGLSAIASEPGSTGSVTVDGAGSSWTTNGGLFLGVSGNGTLNISAGGVVNVTSPLSLAANGISTGTLNIGTGSAAGVLNAPRLFGRFGTATLNFNHTDANYFFTKDGTSGGTAIPITGSIVVNHIGAGTTVLTGANTYSGGTTVSAGTLQGTTTSLQGNITNNANLTFDQTTMGTYSGIISGIGSLTKSNTGTVILSGTNTYSGGTTISAGTLQGTTTSLQGNITNNANLTFDQTTMGTYSGIISGIGSLTKSNTGTVILTGNNTYSGGTTVNAGTLQGTTTSLQGNISNNASITFNQGNNGTYAGVISGTGTLTKTNTGTLTLSGANTYAGGTTVNAGTLIINGSIANSTTTLNHGSTFAGTGTAGSIIINGGIVAPGNSIGTINVNGNVDFSAGGIYQVEVDSAGHTDLISVTGTATLSNGTVAVVPQTGQYNQPTDYTILTAAGGLGGTRFDSVSSTLAFLTPTLSYTANEVILTLARNTETFTSIAKTPNQGGVASTLNRLANINHTGLQDLINRIILLTPTGAQQAFAGLSGSDYTHGQVLTRRHSRRFLSLLLSRGSQSANGQLAMKPLQQFDPMAGPLLADNSHHWQQMDTNGANPPAYSRGWWLQGFGSVGDIESTNNISGANYDTQGLAFGVESEWRDTLIGIASSYTNTKVNTLSGKLGIESWQAAAYAGWQSDGIYVNGAMGFSYHDTAARRTVTIGGTSHIAGADYDTYHIGSTIEAGKDIALTATTSLTPFARVEYTHSKRDDFTETGAEAASLHIKKEDEDSLRATLGLRLSHAIITRKRSRITPSASIAYVREVRDNTPRLNAGFAAAPAPAFRIDGVDLDRDRLQLGVGLSGHINERTTLNVAYNGELAGSDTDHSFAARLRIAW